MYHTISYSTPDTNLSFRVKKHAIDQGGEIIHEYNLIKGFA